jgi:hypothetical protein
MVIEGHAGTGKTTLVNQLLKDLPRLQQTVNLINPDQNKSREVILTATTNKACEALAQSTGREVKTIHSLLGLRVRTDYKTNTTTLACTEQRSVPTDALIFIDEASYVDAELAQYIFDLTRRCKIVFMGDPAQLTTVNGRGAPLFSAGFPTARLSQVVRQADTSQILELATAFRNTVSTGEFFSFQPNGSDIIHLGPEPFYAAVMAEFQRPDWQHGDAKVLAWTNRRVIAYNHAIREQVQGVPQLQAGDYAVCNHYLRTRTCSLKTDQTVLVTGISEAAEHDVAGWMVELNCSRRSHTAFLPRSLAERKAREKQARADGQWALINHIHSHWIDLRAAYACTVNKSQGSTYDRVFIDLDDIKKCRSNNQVARMMYVAVSRARHQVVLSGDLV